MSGVFDAQTVTLSTAASMAASFFSSVFDCGPFDSGSIVASWTGADRTTALLIPQFSIDQVCWCNYVAEASAQRVDGATGCKMYSFPDFTFPYLRFSFVKKSNTTGAMTVQVYAKRQWGLNK